MMMNGFDLDEIEQAISVPIDGAKFGLVALDTSHIAAMLTEIRELRAENARKTALMREVLTHPNVAPCECKSPECLTTRFRAALGEPQ